MEGHFGQGSYLEGENVRAEIAEEESNLPKDQVSAGKEMGRSIQGINATLGFRAKM